jgi:hypothetical protein
MIRRLLVVLAVLGSTVLLASPASADGATSQTQEFHGAFPPMTVGVLCGAPSGTLFATGNAIFHITVDAAGDIWVTTTQEADFTVVPDTGTVTFTGHIAVWFGVSLNLQNAESTTVVNVQATGSDGSTLSFSALAHVTISATGQVNMFMTCH